MQAPAGNGLLLLFSLSSQTRVRVLPPRRNRGRSLPATAGTKMQLLLLEQGSQEHLFQRKCSSSRSPQRVGPSLPS